MTPNVIAEMRDWLSDCQWADMSPEDFDDLTDDELRRGVERFYDGGMARFLTDFHGS